MSNRRRERLKTCSMCYRLAYLVKHGKCGNCRILLTTRRLACTVRVYLKGTRIK